MFPEYCYITATTKCIYHLCQYLQDHQCIVHLQGGVALSCIGTTTYMGAASGFTTTGASVDATPAAATTYTVTGTDANGLFSNSNIV